MLAKCINNRTQFARQPVLCRAGGAKTNIDKIRDTIMVKRAEKTLIAQVAPAVRVGVGEGFGVKAGDISPKQLVKALRKVGFQYVFDTLFSADVTIIEEGTELLQRLKEGKLNDRPMATSCCPGWIALVESNYPEIIPCISTTKSPQMIMGAIVKHVFAESIGIRPQDVYMISFMPCVRKQGEADRPCFGSEEARDVDLVITTNELVQFLHDQEIDLPNEMESDFDQPLGEGTGGAAIFGKSGGVMIAALRYAYWVLTGETLGEVQFSPIPGYQSISEASLTFTPRPDNPVGIPAEEITLNVAVVAGLGDAKKFLKAVGEGKSNHHFVEVMACAPYGCIGGGGNLPVGKNKTLLDERKAALTAFDDNAIKKGAQDNESVRELYEQHLGKPGEGKAHDLLHTHYESKKN